MEALGKDVQRIPGGDNFLIRVFDGHEDGGEREEGGLGALVAEGVKRHRGVR